MLLAAMDAEQIEITPPHRKRSDGRAAKGEHRRFSDPAFRFCRRRAQGRVTVCPMRTHFAMFTKCIGNTPSVCRNRGFLFALFRRRIMGEKEKGSECMEAYTIFKSLCIIVIAAKICGILARKLKAPQVVGRSSRACSSGERFGACGAKRFFSAARRDRRGAVDVFRRAANESP